VSAGAATTLPVGRVVNVRGYLEEAKSSGWWVYGAVLGEGDPVWRVDWGERVVLVLGSEGNGIRPGVREMCDGLVTLPMEGLESLNVSVAAGILIYEFARRGWSSSHLDVDKRR
jgi:23S rRNA (guanosine2251-2'-O)-methyltransferase